MGKNRPRNLKRRRRKRKSSQWREQAREQEKVRRKRMQPGKRVSKMEWRLPRDLGSGLGIEEE